jgi:hypothetical protein
MGLTLKQQRFCDAYLGKAQGNASKASRIAGYRCPGQQGYENLKKPEIQDELKRRTEATGMTSEAILTLLSNIAQGRVNKLPRADTWRISDAVKALFLLGKNLGLWKGQGRDDGSLLDAIRRAEEIAAEYDRGQELLNACDDEK